MITINLLALVLALPVIFRVLCIVYRMGLRGFSGHPLHFMALGLSFILMGAGALAVIFAWAQAAAWLFLVGLLGLVLLDRRRTICMVLDNCRDRAS